MSNGRNQEFYLLEQFDKLFDWWQVKIVRGNVRRYEVSVESRVPTEYQYMRFTQRSNETFGELLERVVSQTSHATLRPQQDEWSEAGGVDDLFR